VNNLKIVSIVGARPQFIKCAPLSRELRKYHCEILVHTGQHYDPDMSDIFFEELQIPKPDYHLGVGSGTHGQQTGEILSQVESVLMKEQPDLVIVYGDTNSTLAGALAAVKLHISVAHVEAGMRSFDRLMPEEINRVVTDHISSLHFCPTQTSVDNLLKEGITQGVHLVGDVMVDALEYNRNIAEDKSDIVQRLGLKNHTYLVLTVHRPANTDSQKNMTGIISAIGESGKPTIFPVHPRTKKYLLDYGLWATLPSNIHVTEPLGYLDILKLMGHAEKILTDSGGMQKEAFILGVPCITLRGTTEWVETLEGGWNVLVGSDKDQIIHAIYASNPVTQKKNSNFKPGACKSIIHILNKNQ
jgi:UDP-N-acetylglucosamine 2-epimerase (non-hydrolysing)